MFFNVQDGILYVALYICGYVNNFMYCVYVYVL